MKINEEGAKHEKTESKKKEAREPNEGLKDALGQKPKMPMMKGKMPMMRGQY